MLASTSQSLGWGTQYFTGGSSPVLCVLEEQGVQDPRLQLDDSGGEGGLPGLEDTMRMETTRILGPFLALRPPGKEKAYRSPGFFCFPEQVHAMPPAQHLICLAVPTLELIASSL